MIIFLISKLMGAQEITATVGSYKKINGKNYRMYLTVNHEKAPEQLWLDEMFQINEAHPDPAVGSVIEVFWVPGRRTAMRANTLKRSAISLVIGLAAIIIGIVLTFIGASVE